MNPFSSLTDAGHAPSGKKSLGRVPWLECVFLVVAVGLLLSSPNSTSVKALSLIFSSIILEAVPFMLFGSVVGGLIEAFVSRERMAEILPRRGWLTVLMAAGAGLAFPICECAVVPVVRRLARKGLPAGAAIAYLLGGPIVNPIVAASTAMAYKLDWLVVLLRVGCGYLIAVGIGLLMNRLFRAGEVFRADLHDHDEGTGCSCGCGHDHHHNHEMSHEHHNHPAQHGKTPFGSKLIAAFGHAADDFLAVGHFLVIGAFLAAVAQTYVNRAAFVQLADVPVLPSVLMMALAVSLNLCSEADAFIAASFRGLVGLPGQMAFLLTGPMFDLKLLLMYQSVFRKRAIAALSLLILLVVFLAVLGIELVGGRSV